MGRINYESVVFRQDGWKEERGIPQNKRLGLNKLCKMLMHRAIEHNHELDDLKLFYPEDCSDYDAFMSFASAFEAFVRPKNNGKGLVMFNFGKNKDDVEVE